MCRFWDIVKCRKIILCRTKYCVKGRKEGWWAKCFTQKERVVISQYTNTSTLRVTVRKQAPSPGWQWPAITLYLPLLQRICSHQPSSTCFGLVNGQEWHCHCQNVCTFSNVNAPSLVWAGNELYWRLHLDPVFSDSASHKSRKVTIDILILKYFLH
jgi:hypothetical protein